MAVSIDTNDRAAALSKAMAAPQPGRLPAAPTANSDFAFFAPSR